MTEPTGACLCVKQMATMNQCCHAYVVSDDQWASTVVVIAVARLTYALGSTHRLAIQTTVGARDTTVCTAGHGQHGAASHHPSLALPASTATAVKQQPQQQQLLAAAPALHSAVLKRQAMAQSSASWMHWVCVALQLELEPGRGLVDVALTTCQLHSDIAESGVVLTVNQVSYGVA